MRKRKIEKDAIEISQKRIDYDESAIDDQHVAYLHICLFKIMWPAWNSCWCHGFGLTTSAPVGEHLTAIAIGAETDRLVVTLCTACCDRWNKHWNVSSASKHFDSFSFRII